MDEENVAAAMGILRDTYYQWLSRGRTKLRQQIEFEDCQVLFPDLYGKKRHEKARRIQLEGQE